MKTVYNKLIPFKGFYAITILWYIFVRSEYKSRHNTATYYRMLNHEGIHEAQILDFTPSCFNYYVRMILGAVPFYLIYFFEWLFKLPKYKGRAYNNISFEKEAYSHAGDKDYISGRIRFAQWKSLK